MSGKVSMLKERNIKIYKATYDYLKEKKPENADLEQYFLGENRDFKSLTDVYIQFLKSAQNYQAMPNIINFEKRQNEISSFLFGFDYKKIAEMSENDLYRNLRQRFSPASPDTRKNSWYKWSCAAVDSARFICGFDDADDFKAFVKRFDYNADSRMALPLLIQTKIRGIGFALACDALKELGYTDYPKPDVHLIDVFREIGLCKGTPSRVYESIVRMADDNGETPYKVDKVFWLICSGEYYHENNENRSRKGYKRELIELLKSLLAEET